MEYFSEDWIFRDENIRISKSTICGFVLLLVNIFYIKLAFETLYFIVVVNTAVFEYFVYNI